MINDHPAIRKYAPTAIRNLWARRSTARPEELADIDTDLWRLLEAVATGKLPSRAAEYHGPVPDRAVTVRLFSVAEANMAGEWTTEVVLTRRRNGCFTLGLRYVEERRTRTARRSPPFRSGADFVRHLLDWGGLDFGDAGRHGSVQALLPWVALLSPRLADEIAIELVMTAEVDE